MKTLEMTNVAVNGVTVGENTRTIMNKEALKELTANVKAHGVLEPIVLRKNGSKLELVAGARRLQAAKDAGLKHIPANIMELTEQEAERVQAIENLHREDLNPADEAEMFENLLMANKKIEDLALELNKSKNYITRSVALLSLPKPVFERVRKGTLTAAHGHAVVRVVQLDDKEKLKKVVEYLGTDPDYTPTPMEVRNFIDKWMTRDLKTAPFDKTECSKCQKCTKNQTALFDTIAEELCDDAACFRKKMTEFQKAIAEKAKTNGNKGMKYLGAKEIRQDYRTNLMTAGKAGVVLDTKLLKRADIKKALKETPEKFGFVLDKETNKPKTVVTDEKLLEKLTGKKAEEQKAEEVDWDKKRFIGGAVQDALAGILKGKIKPTPERFERLFEEISLRDSTVKAYLGHTDTEAKNLKAMTPETFVEMLMVDSVLRGTERNEHAEKLVKGTTKQLAEVAKKAEAAWPAEKAKRAEAEKAQASTPETEE